VAPLAKSVNHGSANAQVGPAAKRDSAGFVEGLGRAEKALATEGTQVVERHGERDRPPDLTSHEIDQVELGLEAGENLR
jgi:hypothetical protein